MCTAPDKLITLKHYIVTVSHKQPIDGKLGPDSLVCIGCFKRDHNIEL